MCMYYDIVSFDGAWRKPSKYLLNLKKHVNKCISCILNDDYIRSTLTRSDDILTEARNFCKKLYSFREIDAEADFKYDVFHVDRHDMLLSHCAWRI